MKPQKIIIFGISGSGKTTLTKKLSQKYNYTPIYMDEHFWLENWKEQEESVFFSKLDELVSSKKWILEGALGRMINRYADKADLIIWLNFSPVLGVYRVFTRYLKQKIGIKRFEMPMGCDEKIDFSFYKWILEYRKKRASKLRDFFEEKGLNYIELKNQKDLSRYLESIGLEI